ncbi:hypothetical protein LEN26_001743 [Aphanomyces euteiches]|nr:hypothetical protein AeMF1_012700 [Aphanomyces euteiches]KAH9160676.1 hypothetical protein LEN26_001743 [Aphanomyces euteiches]KAH9183686.1 hypothetical protein AeNC1_014338 [Aphanomyces euteiches]
MRSTAFTLVLLAIFAAVIAGFQATEDRIAQFDNARDAAIARKLNVDAVTFAQLKEQLEDRKLFLSEETREKLRAAVGKVSSKVKEVVGKVKDKVKAAYGKVKERVKGVGKKIKERVKGAGEKIKGAYRRVKNRVKGGAKKFKNRVKGAYGKAKNRAKRAYGKAKDRVKNFAKRVRSKFSKKKNDEEASTLKSTEGN